VKKHRCYRLLLCEVLRPQCPISKSCSAKGQHTASEFISHEDRTGFGGQVRRQGTAGHLRGTLSVHSRDAVGRGDAKPRGSPLLSARQVHVA
jgi:hypothetical protein